MNNTTSSPVITGIANHTIRIYDAESFDLIREATGLTSNRARARYRVTEMLAETLPTGTGYLIEWREGAKLLKFHAVMGKADPEAC